MVSTMLDDVADGIVGRQLGEDGVLLLATISVLPIVQKYFLFSIYQEPLGVGSTPPPSYHDILICLVAIAGGVETSTTIFTFVYALLRSGINIDHRYNIFSFLVCVHLLLFVNWYIHHYYRSIRLLTLSTINLFTWAFGLSSFVGILASASS
jgi:hypothetical protein